MKKLFTTLFLAFVAAAATAQIPNADFESWDSSLGYKTPVGWDNMNAATNASSVYTCERGTPGYGGNYYLMLTSRTVSGSVVLGYAASGTMDPVTHQPISGFPYSLRPQGLAGVWQYMAMSSSDQGFISVTLTKWNSASNKRDTIANTFYPLPAMYMYWQPFYLPLHYVSTANPDSALIVLSSGGASFGAPADGSFLYVDELKFADSATLSSQNIDASNPGSSIFPNPSAGQATVFYHSSTEKTLQISVSDISGRLVFSAMYTAKTGNNQFPINISGAPRGIYMVKVVDEQFTEVKRLIVQ
jgi:hypothetical protein